MWQNSQDTSFSADGGFSRTQASDGAPAKRDNLVHMLIADYLNQGEEVIVEGFNVDMMVFVGKVLSVMPGTGMIEYELEDGTGTLHLKALIDPKDDAADIPVGCYARVFCTPKILSGQKTAVVLRIFPLGFDDSAVALHGLHVKHDKLLIRQTLKAAETPTGGDGGFNDQDNSKRGIITRTVGELFKNVPDPAVGVHIKDIISALSHRIPEAEIRSIVVDELANDGTLYMTTDDDHFAPIF